jgi:hypothetical protein
MSKGDPGELRSKLGIYHWGGRHAAGFEAGIRDLISLNAGIARIALGPKSDIDYNRGKSCIGGFSLPRALDDLDLRSALAHPRLKVVVMTVFDGASFGDCQTHSYLSPAFYTPDRRAALIEEYSDFVYRLYVLFHGTGKQFILSNWEGDNAIYCGSAHRFVISGQFRAQCLSAYPISYAGNRHPHDSIQGMILWFNARHTGVERGRERALRDGYTGVRTAIAPEFSAVRMLRDHGLWSVLFDVIPRVRFDYVSYSAYESLDSPDPSSTLKADLDTIRAVTGVEPGQIVIGEFGFANSVYGTSQIERSKAVAEAAIAWGVFFLLQWNLYDQDRENNFGLFDGDGNITELGRHYREWLKPEPAFGSEFTVNTSRLLPLSLHPAQTPHKAGDAR